MELKDPDNLKCNILQVLIKYPNGLNFGDFSGAFYEIHHFHPKFSHYGFSSLRDVIDNMRETVIVERSKSYGTVMKLVSGLNLDGLLDEDEKSGPDSFEEEDSRLNEEKERRTNGEDTDTAAADLADVLAAITNLLLEYESGLKFEKIQALLLSAVGINLQSFSITKGYKDVLTFLQDQIPNLIIRHGESIHRCVVQLSKDLTVASVPICSILKFYPDGLKLSKLKEAVKKTCGYDLEVFCYQVGFSNIVSCLQEIPELIISRNRNRNCRVQLKPASFRCSSSRSSHPPLEQPTCKSKNVKQVASERPVLFSSSSYQSSYSSSSKSDQSTPNNSNHYEYKKKPLLGEVMALITALLSNYRNGLTISKLQDYFLVKDGINLEKFSIAQGYRDSMEFLEKRMPQLMLNYQIDRLNSIATEPHSVLKKVMASLTALLSRYMSGLKVKKLQDLFMAKEGIDLQKFSFALGHKDTVAFLEDKMPHLTLIYKTNRLSSVVIKSHSVPRLKSTGTAEPPNSAPVLSEVMALVSALLSNYKNGLKIWKLQEFLLLRDGIDLKKFSVVQGYRDTVDFLERMMPQLRLNYHTDRPNTVVSEPHSDLKDNSISASTISDPSASDSPCQNIPASIAAVPPEVNNVFHTNQSCPPAMSSNLPSFHESPKSSSFSSVVLSQQPNPCQLCAKLVTEEITSNSQVTTFQPSTVQDELKQQVARILAKHPKGMSLFQFRIVYSASFKKHFPVGDASSIKQRLLEMPDTVSVKGHGVQTLLLPVYHDVSPEEPDQPASSKVENVAVVSSLSLAHPVPVETLDSHSVLTSPLDSPEKPGSKDLSLSQEQKKSRTSLRGFPDQLDSSKVEDIPVLPGHSSPKNESLSVPESFLMPAVPRAAMMPTPKPRHSFLQYYQSIRVLENKGNNPFTELHTQSIPGSIKIMKMKKSHLNGPDPKLRETPFIPSCPVALPTYSQGTVRGENLQPGVVKSRFADTVPSVDSTPFPTVLLKPSEIHSRRSAPQSSDSIQPVLPLQPPPRMLSTESDSFPEAQKQSRASQHFSGPDSSAKRSSASSLPRNSASSLTSKSQLNHQLPQPTQPRLDNLQPTGRSLGKASLDSVSPAVRYQRKPTHRSPFETIPTTESFIACSVSGSLHTSSVITSNSRASSSVSSRTTALSPAASPLVSTANSCDQIAHDSAKITSKSSPLFSETRASTQQRQYARAASTVTSNTKTTSPTSWSSESVICSHHQFAYASSRITTNSSNLSSEAYAYTHQRQNIQASEAIIASRATASSISPLDSTTSLPCQHAYASAKATSAPSFSSTTYTTPTAEFKASLNGDSPTQDNPTPSLSKQEDQSASPQEKEVTDLVSRIQSGCFIL